jgi:hypothetical protein
VVPVHASRTLDDLGRSNGGALVRARTTAYSLMEEAAARASRSPASRTAGISSPSLPRSWTP